MKKVELPDSIDFSKPYYRLNPLSFARKASAVEEEITYRPYKLHKFLMSILLKSIYDPKLKTIINTPPQHGKSYTLAWFVAWFLEMFPHKNVIWTSYDGDLAVKNGSVVRSILRNNKYSLTTMVKDSEELLTTTKRGQAIFKASDKGITGNPADLIIIDDPAKSSKFYQNPKNIKKQVRWFEEVIDTRAKGHVPIILITTRWHEMDLVGWFLEYSAYNWQHYNFQAIAEKNDILGRKEGEPLCPEIQPLDVLELKRKNNPDMFNLVYQGIPTPKDGKVWLKKYWQTWRPIDIPPRWDEKIVSVDATFDDTENAAECAIEVWAKKGQRLFLLDAVAEKMDFSETCTILESVLDRHSDFHALLIEKKANGSAIKSTFEQRYDNIVMIEPLGSKMERAEACKPFLKAGLIYLPVEHPTNQKWLPKFIGQASKFPNGQYDDMVDAASQAILYLKDLAGDKKINTIEALAGWRL